MICQTVTNPHTMREVYQLRTRVFVNEQGVSADEEFDEFEDKSTHWAACSGDKVIGCARHRRTGAGFKIERMAVHEEWRNQGVGRQLLLKILDALLPELNNGTPEGSSEPSPEIYLHAQVQAMPFYKRLGFVPVGELFYEAGIAHYRCIYQGMED